MASSVMVMGTASNVGKSILCTALCRILHEDGYSVAPFKAQNMSLNSAATPSGREIGRAQAVQAEACGILPNEHMNPVLLKPTGRHQTQVVVQGRVYKTTSARDYLENRLDDVWEAVVDSYRFLADRYEWIVIEGAGSPVEMNLKPRDIANVRTAELADAHVLLVADIDRGGVFASIVGTLQLLEPSERARVKGIIINKFRGDRSLFTDGIRWIESYTGVPVLGVLPFLPDLNIEAEDSVALEEARYRLPAADGAVRVAVIQLPHMANFTDFDPLFLTPGVTVRFVQTPAELEDVHAIILPGSKDTLMDGLWLQETGLSAALAERRAAGCHIVGICGGFQLLGQRILDPDHWEGPIDEVAGLGWLPVVTTMTGSKRTMPVTGRVLGPLGPMPVEGYEIHMGRTERLAGGSPFAQVQSPDGDGAWFDGAVSDDGRVMGTYLHGIFHNDQFRRRWLTAICHQFGLQVPAAPDTSFSEMKSAALRRLSSAVRAHLDMPRLYGILGYAPKRGTPAETGGPALS
ncbi:cobyric acid synthase [Alicyclobacillus contaminans]|uniref:cobyric acid synthase n=1 Tax=Alicyclobacillus contaminans TaxID=392016 RepID=UPI000400C2CA|nr:cobyric acid synthase [Alicyclobacillus contaminans]GMA48773.1 cobyric acid synthase [Alicyclobacillus contaminans]